MARINDGEIVNGTYTVVGSLGEGGMGAVVLVTDPAGGTFALKYCTSDDAELLRRFAREVRVMLGIEHHNVMPIVAHNLEHDPPYFVMPVAERSIAEEIAALRGEEARALSVFRQIAVGVQAIHTAGATHRDLKPLNVLRLSAQRVVVSDLGLAKMNTRDTTVLTRTLVMLGTEAYSAPEQWLPAGTREADARTDVYQLGKVLYELVTGDIPHLLDMDRLQAGLRFVIQKATRNRPEDRYQTVGEMLDGIAAYELSRDPRAHPTSAFDTLLLAANELMAQGQYDHDHARQLVAIVLGAADDARLVVEMVQKLPDALLQAIVANMPDEADALVGAYVRAIDEAIDDYGYEYAEVVARKMRAVFTTPARPEVAAAALGAVLRAAISRNRFAAMDAFNAMLASIRRPDLAVAVAHMLRERIDDYRQIAENVPATKLHAAIRQVQAVATGELARNGE